MKCKTFKSFPRKNTNDNEVYEMYSIRRYTHIKCSNFLVFVFSLAVNLQGFILNYNLIFVLFNEFNQTSVVSSSFFSLDFFFSLRLNMLNISNYDGFSAFLPDWKIHLRLISYFMERFDVCTTTRNRDEEWGR